MCCWDDMLLIKKNTQKKDTKKNYYKNTMFKLEEPSKFIAIKIYT